MIIRELEITSFGKFKNRSFSFSEGLNIIRGDNESGKSTIINFIYAMLYGFGDNRGKSLSFREKYIPWDADFCEGKLLLTTEEGKNITIYRKSGSIKKYDILKVYDSDTGEEIQKDPKFFPGVSGETFLKTLCIRQLSTVFDGSNDEIAQRLSNIASSADESADYEKALKILEGVRREIQPQRGNGGELHKLNQKINELEKGRRDAESALSELAIISGTISAAQKERDRLREEFSSLASDDTGIALAHIEGRMEEISRQNKLSPFMVRAALVVSAILALCLIFFKPLLSLPFIITASLCIFEIARKKRLTANTDKLSSEKEILESQKSIKEKRLADLRKALDAAEERLSSLLMREMSLKSRIDGNQGGLEGLYAEKNMLEKKLRAVNNASEALRNAHISMQKNFTPMLNKKASLYFQNITGGKYNHIFCDEDFGVKIEGGIPRESSFFSGGTVDQLYLSIRLALIDMLFGEKTCSVILDQPFIQYDEKRKSNTVGLLESLPKNRQLLLFTSDKTLNSANKETEILT